ncbi:hypothetical protein PG997_006489 [Apiospora hydei]|uniref:Uncharacterized protein n=1 Tax=Apiospora hydei TaxID=1337664 RepID=A0ABR1WRY1_9PEZI
MSYLNIAFRDWVTNWELDTIHKISCYDGLGNYSLELDNAGRRTVGVIGNLLLDRYTSRETAIHLVDIRWTGLGGQGIAMRGIWKVLCLAIEIFCCHRSSRVKLAATVAQMAPFDLVRSAKAGLEGPLAGWSSAFIAHFASRSKTLPPPPCFRHCITHSHA